MKHKMAQCGGYLTEKNTPEMETTALVTPGDEKHNKDIINIGRMCNKHKSIDLIEDQYEEEFDRIMQEQENQECTSDEAIIRDIVNSVIAINKTKDLKRHENMGHDSQTSTPESMERETENNTEVTPLEISIKTADDSSTEKKTQAGSTSPLVSIKTQNCSEKPSDSTPSSMPESMEQETENITQVKPPSTSTKTANEHSELNNSVPSRPTLESIEWQTKAGSPSPSVRRKIQNYPVEPNDSKPSTRIPVSKEHVEENITEVKPPSTSTKTEGSQLNNSERSRPTLELIEQKTEAVGLTISPSIRKKQNCPSKPNDSKSNTPKSTKHKIEKIPTAKPFSLNKKTEDYPSELNPFADDDNEACCTNPFGDGDNATDKTGNSTNPFGDSDNETDKRGHGTNPFGDSDDEEEEIRQKEQTPKPMPRRKISVVNQSNNDHDNTIKLPVPLPRMLSRSTPVTPNQSPLLQVSRSFRLPGSSSSLGGPNASAYNSIRRKKKPAPTPPKQALPSQVESSVPMTVSATSNNQHPNITVTSFPSLALSTKTPNTMTLNNQPLHYSLSSKTPSPLGTPTKSNTRPRKSRMAPPPPTLAPSGAHKSLM